MIGQLWFHFASAILLTVVVSRVILAWYRRAVARNMLAAGGAAPGNDAWNGPERTPAGLPATAQDEPDADRTFTVERRLRRRVAMIYGLGGLAAASVMTTLFLHALGDEILPVRTFLTLFAFSWPIIPTVSFLVAHSRKRTLIAF